nr:proline-rich receptor-like protein kinase PERK8 [Aegilops tauschii subsp. strangulata]
MVAGRSFVLLQHPAEEAVCKTPVVFASVASALDFMGYNWRWPLVFYFSSMMAVGGDVLAVTSSTSICHVAPPTLSLLPLPPGPRSLDRARPGLRRARGSPRLAPPVAAVLRPADPPNIAPPPVLAISPPCAAATDPAPPPVRGRDPAPRRPTPLRSGRRLPPTPARRPTRARDQPPPPARPPSAAVGAGSGEERLGSGPFRPLQPSSSSPATSPANSGEVPRIGTRSTNCAQPNTVPAPDLVVPHASVPG